MLASPNIIRLFFETLNAKGLDVNQVEAKIGRKLTADYIETLFTVDDQGRMLATAEFNNLISQL